MSALCARRSKRSRTGTSQVFTGIVREVGVVAAVAGGEAGVRLTVAAPVTASGIVLGGSVAISGVCLTAVGIGDRELVFEAVPETLARTSLGSLVAGARVNIEPALLAGEPLGGHYVQGHVDGVGTVRSVTPEGDGVRIGFTVPADLLRYVAFKGSITIEGVSLTVAALDATGLEVALIPHTLEATTLGGLVVGDPVNLEVDVLAKYVERMTSVTASSTPSAS